MGRVAAMENTPSLKPGGRYRGTGVRAACLRQLARHDLLRVGRQAVAALWRRVPGKGVQARSVLGAASPLRGIRLAGDAGHLPGCEPGTAMPRLSPTPRSDTLRNTAVALGRTTFWMQTTGAALLATEWRSVVRLRTPAQDSRSAHGLLYLAAVRGGICLPMSKALRPSTFTQCYSPRRRALRHPTADI